MTIVQSKLKECVHKGSMNSFEQLAAVFQTRDGATEMGNKPMDVLPVEGLPVLEKGENKVPTKSVFDAAISLWGLCFLLSLAQAVSEERKKTKP
jgi:hypothetical protein